MLLPALNAARDKAKTANCLANLKQIGHAQGLYANDFDDFIPKGKFKEKPTNTWYWFSGLSSLYLGGTPDNTYINGTVFNAVNEKVFTCPSEPGKWGPYAQNLFTYTHYGVNTWLNGDDEGVWRKMTQVKRPSLAVFSLDTARKNTYSIKYADSIYIALRHHQQLNEVLADGHTESQTLQEFFELKNGGNIWFGRLKLGYLP